MPTSFPDLKVTLHWGEVVSEIELDSAEALDPSQFALVLAVAFAVAFAAVAWRPVWVVRFPRVILLVITGLSLLALTPLVAWDPPGLDLHIDPSTEPLLPRGDPAQEVYRQAVRDFGDDEVFVIFGDTTNGAETYGGGRFLYADLVPGSRIVLDFNKAYNPPCAFTPYATCPLPPRQNRLPLAIRAGEKKYGQGHH